MTLTIFIFNVKIIKY